MLILASMSRTRQDLLRAANVAFEARPPRVDEAMVKEALTAEEHPPRSVADALAEMKALKVRAEGLVLGCDQVLDRDGEIVSKPATPQEAMAQLTSLSGGTHRLHTAAVIAEGGRPIWRQVSTVTLTMRAASPGYITDYVARTWETVRHSAGAYTLEGEGARFFTRVDGDHFAVLGLPLLPLLDFLVSRGELPA